MKKRMLYCFLGAGLYLLLGAGAASAQSLETLMTVQAPFDFQINDRRMPAGEYVIRRDPQAPQFLQLHCSKRRVTAIVHVMPLHLAAYPTKDSLAFREYGDKRFLSEIRVAKYGNGYALLRSKAERELARARTR